MEKQKQGKFQFELENLVSQYGRHKPPKKGTASVTPMNWWKFALSAAKENVNERTKRWDWTWIKFRSECRKSYIELYKKVLQEEMVTQSSPSFAKTL